MCLNSEKGTLLNGNSLTDLALLQLTLIDLDRAAGMHHGKEILRLSRPGLATLIMYTGPQA